MGMPRLWVPETENERRAKTIEELTPNRSALDKFAGEALPAWSVEADARFHRRSSWLSGSLGEQACADIRAKATVQDKIDAWREIGKARVVK